MIRIEISGDTPAVIRAELQDLLRMYPSDLQEKFGVPEPTLSALHSMPSNWINKDMLAKAAVAAGEVVEVTAVTGADHATTALVYHDDPKPFAAPSQSVPVGPEVVAAAEPARRGRGRPKKQNTSATEADAQPAVASNTGSGSAGNETPPAGTVQGDAAGTPLTSDAAATVAVTPAAAQHTNAQMRAALQELCEAAPDMNTGQILAKEILATFQYQKVGQVQDQHLAGIIEKAKGATARVSEEADKADRGPLFEKITAELVAARQ